MMMMMMMIKKMKQNTGQQRFCYCLFTRVLYHSSIFQRSTSGLNSKFSFSDTGCRDKAKELSL